MPKIECCRDCAPPKRRPGCHGSCPEYRMERAELDRKNAEERAKRQTRQNLYAQRLDGVRKAGKSKRIDGKGRKDK